MAVLCESYSVVVRNSTLAAKYPGGLEVFRRDCPNNTFCADDHLSRVGFMVLQDAKAFIGDLQAKGLTPYRGGACDEVALLDPNGGPVCPCEWLQWGWRYGVAVAWLSGSGVGDLHAPRWWNAYDPMRSVPAAEARERLEFVRNDGPVHVYRDKTTGQEYYVGRTTSGAGPNESRHDQLYKQAWALAQNFILYHGQAPTELGKGDRRHLGEATALLDEVLRINPSNWAAMWLLGKIAQRLGDFEGALRWFARAHQIKPDQPDVAREAAIAAMELGRPGEAVPFCERAVAAKPDDAGLRANLALALLFSDKPGEARSVADDAPRRDPGDAITAHIVKIIDEVLSGARRCPHHARDLGGDA